MYIKPLSMYEAFIDLDELIARCTDKQAKQFIKEAVPVTTLITRFEAFSQALSLSFDKD